MARSPVKAALIAVAAVVAASALAAPIAGCVDERNIALPLFAPNAAVLLVVQGVHPAVVHAFQADAQGHARLPAFSASEEDIIALGEYGCTLDALQIEAGWHQTDSNPDENIGRPLPEDPVHTYRLSSAGVFEEGPLPEPLKLRGDPPTGCVELTPTYQLLLDIEGPAEAPVALALEDGVLIQPFAFANEIAFSTAFLVRKDRGAEVLSKFPAFVRGAFREANDTLTLVDSNGTVFTGTVSGDFTQTATLSREYLFYAAIDRAPGSDRYFIATSRPGFYQLDANRRAVTPLYVPTICQEECTEGGVLAVSDTEAFAVLTKEAQVLHWREGAELQRETLDRAGFHTPTRLTGRSNRQPLAGSQLGGVFTRFEERWRFLEASLIRELDFLVEIPGGIVFSQTRGLLAEYQLDAMKLCPTIELESNQIFAVFMAGDELVIVDRTPDLRLRVSFNALQRRFNRCGENTP